LVTAHLLGLENEKNLDIAPAGPCQRIAVGKRGVWGGCRLSPLMGTTKSCANPRGETPKTGGSTKIGGQNNGALSSPWCPDGGLAAQAMDRKHAL
jgi:hypothetical protein